MAQYSHFRRTVTNLKTAGVSSQVAWYGIATIASFEDCTISKINYCHNDETMKEP